MSRYLLEKAANASLDDIYAYTKETWSEAQADTYLTGMFARFEAIASGTVHAREVDAAFGIKAWFCRYRHHYVYWKRLDDGRIGIMAILHERMHQAARLCDVLETDQDARPDDSAR